MSSAVDLVQGLGVLTGIEVVDVPGATAGFDNDYAAQRDACLASLADRDLFVLHVEATDEAGHQGAVDDEGRRARAVGRRRSSARSSTRSTRAASRTAILLHARPRDAVRRSRPTPPIRCRTCCSTPTRPGPGGVYTEPATAGCAPGRRRTR